MPPMMMMILTLNREDGCLTLFRLIIIEDGGLISTMLIYRHAHATPYRHAGIDWCCRPPIFIINILFCHRRMIPLSITYAMSPIDREGRRDVTVSTGCRHYRMDDDATTTPSRRAATSPSRIYHHHQPGAIWFSFSIIAFFDNGWMNDFW